MDSAYPFTKGGCIKQIAAWRKDPNQEGLFMIDRSLPSILSAATCRGSYSTPRQSKPFWLLCQGCWCLPPSWCCPRRPQVYYWYTVSWYFLLNEFWAGWTFNQYFAVVAMFMKQVIFVIYSNIPCPDKSLGLSQLAWFKCTLVLFAGFSTETGLEQGPCFSSV